MKVISITGGVGAGKSKVLRLLKEDFGAKLIIADDIAKQLMEPGTVGLHLVEQTLGLSFLKEDGSVDRDKLSACLFGNKELVKRVNGIIHPLVWDRIQEEIRSSDTKLAAVEAALFDKEHNTLFDEIWYVYADPELRIKRLMEKRGYSREKCLRIMEHQASDEEYRASADRVIDNSATISALRQELCHILEEDEKI